MRKKGIWMLGVAIIAAFLVAVPFRARVSGTTGETRFMMGLVYINMGLSESAIHELEQVAPIMPENSEVPLLLGLLFDSLGQRDAAIYQYRRFISMESQKPGSGSRVAPIKVLIANNYFEKGQTESAEALYREALKTDDELAMAYYGLGRIYQARGQRQDALNAFQSTVKINSEFMEPRLNMALLYQEAGDVDQAVGVYKEAIKIDSHNPELFYRLGLAYKAKGQKQEAIDALDRALRLKADFLDAAQVLSELKGN
ncbi:MAG: tetratricopeptide repeat protein [Syntrophothermus sp.]